MAKRCSTMLVATLFFGGALPRCLPQGIPYAVFLFRGAGCCPGLTFPPRSCPQNVVGGKPEQSSTQSVFSRRIGPFPRRFWPVDFGIGFVVLLILLRSRHTFPAGRCLPSPFLLRRRLRFSGRWPLAFGAQPLYRDVQNLTPFLVSLDARSSVCYSSPWFPSVYRGTLRLEYHGGGVIDGFRWAPWHRSNPTATLLASTLIDLLRLSRRDHLIQLKEGA